MDLFDEVVERVKRLTGLQGRAASAVAMAATDDAEARAAEVNSHLTGPDDPDVQAQPIVTAADIVRAARELGIHVEAPSRDASTTDALTLGLRELQLEPDATRVLAEVYKTMPRVLNPEMPRVGRAPKDSVFYNDELQAQIDALPEEVRVLIGGVDLVNGQLTLRLYDEANDLDREIGPIDLTRYESAEQLQRGVETLISRLPRVLASDFN